MDIAQNNIDSIVDQYKKALPGTKLTSLQTAIKVKALSAVIGEDMATKLGKIAFITSGGTLIEGVLNKIFGKKQAWSGLNGEDKGNLIDSLIIEAIYQKNIVFLEPIKAYIYTRLKESKIVTTSEEAEFWTKNVWAQNHIIEELKKYNETLRFVNEIVDYSKLAVERYEISKYSNVAIMAIYNYKKGQLPSEAEKEAIAIYLKQINAIEKAKQLKDIGTIVPGDGRG